MDKLFCGSGRTKTGQYGEFYSVSICLDEIPTEHITTANNGKRYVNLTVSKKKEKDQYGKDLSVTIDTWKPEKQEKQAHTPKQEYSLPNDNELPF